MIRNLKVLGAAVMAICAMSAITASAASAVQFHSEQEHTILTGNQVGEDVFTTNAGTVKCKKASYKGTLAVATTTTASASAAYSECVAFGFANTPIVMNGCEYLFHVEAVVNGKNEGSVDIVCPGSSVIEVKAANCTVTIGSQTGLKSATFTNEGTGTGRYIKIDVNLTGIKYTQDPGSFFPCTGGTFTNGTYTGVATVSGENELEEPIGIWVE